MNQPTDDLLVINNSHLSDKQVDEILDGLSTGKTLITGYHLDLSGSIEKGHVSVDVTLGLYNQDVTHDHSD